MRLIALLTALTFALTFALPAKADRFDDAVTAWLAVDDATALPLLAELANSGDERAMLLLGVIDARRYPSDFLDALAPDDYNALMRLPGGFRGQSWFTRVTERSELAEAIERPDALRAAEQARFLIAKGEFGAAQPLITMLSFQNPGGLVSLSSQVELPDAFKVQLWLAALWARDQQVPVEGADAAAVVAEATSPDWQGSLPYHLFMAEDVAVQLGIDLSPEDAELNALLWGGEVVYDLNRGLDPAGDQSAERKALRDRAAEVLYGASELGPIRAQCERACPDAPSDCVNAVFGAIGGFRPLVASLAPLASEIAPELYYASPRYIEDLTANAPLLKMGLPPARSDALCGRALLGQ